jgi:hypothetical protein
MDVRMNALNNNVHQAEKHRTLSSRSHLLHFARSFSSELKYSQTLEDFCLFGTMLMFITLLVGVFSCRRSHSHHSPQLLAMECTLNAR